MRRILTVKPDDAIIGLPGQSEVKCDCCNNTIFDGKDLSLWRWVQNGILDMYSEKCYLICKGCLISEYNFDKRNFNKVA